MFKLFPETHIGAQENEATCCSSFEVERSVRETALSREILLGTGNKALSYTVPDVVGEAVTEWKKGVT